MINTNTIVNAVEKHGTIFLDFQLNPVVPEPGQWFCEYDDDWDCGESNFCQDGALVEYLGPCENMVVTAEGAAPYGDPKFRHQVAVDGDYENVRRPSCRALIRQS